jgi:hypothetical protein
VIPTDLFLAFTLLSGPPVGQGDTDDASSSGLDASGVSAPAPADPDAPDPEGDPEGDPEDDDATMDAFFGGGDDEDEDEDEDDEGEPPGPVEGPEPAQQETEVAPDDDDDLDLADIFGDADAIDELPDAEDVPSSGPANGSGLFNGKLDLRLRVVSSIYVDIDNLYDGKRWNARQPSLGESVEPPSAFKVGQAIPRGTISRNENRLEFYFSYRPNDHIQIVGDIEPVFLGVSQISALNDLSSVQMLTPFHIESDAAYVSIIDALPGLDITLGRQIVVWGTADKFSPTNNINADDLEDRPLFTEPIANQMLVVDFAPWQDKLWFQGVYVPLFYPALLPPSASSALSDPQTPVNFANQADKDKLAFLQGFISGNAQFNPRVTTSVKPPPVNITNGQAAAKLGSRVGPIDMSASYYYGFFDIPIPYETKSTQLAPLMQDSVDGYWFQSDVTLVYPRMHVIGLDFAAQVPFLDDMGLWGEAALIVPTQEYGFNVELPLNLDITPGDGVMNPVSQFSGPIVKNQPFIKATVGADYTFGKHVYVQTQYLRGFIDDFGANNIGNYLLAGTDLVFFGRHLIFRFFALTDFPKNRQDAPSVVLAPNIIIVPPWGYATLELGGFAFLGREDTKFGQAAVGSSIAYLKIAGSF